MTLDARQEQELTGCGDTMLHYHLADRATNAQLQSTVRQTTVTVSRALTESDDILLVDTTAGSVTLTLPLAKGGKEYSAVKVVAANSMLLACSGTDTICGDTSLTATVCWTSIHIKASNGSWIIL
jgi:hypothetical protein